MKTARHEEPMLVHAGRTPTPLITRGFQVCGDFTGTLRERVICLERKSRQVPMVGWKRDVAVSYPVQRCDGA